MNNPFFNTVISGRMAKALVFSLLFPLAALGDGKQASPTPTESAPANPWAFNLTLYTWMAGVSGDFAAGPITQSVDASFIDINNQSRRFPLGFMGRAEAHYNRWSFYLDGNYVDVKLKPKFSRVGSGLDSELGVMDYGIRYRVLGPAAAEARRYVGKKKINWLEVFAGGRTLWVDNSVQLSGPFGRQRQLSASKAFTSPIIGSRFLLGLTPNWFLLVEGNIGGFGVDNVNFTSGALGAVGYRTSFFDFPVSLEAGYKALQYNVHGGNAVKLKADATLNGPFIGFTGYW